MRAVQRASPPKNTRLQSKELRGAINQRKVNNDLWGMGYELLTQKLGGRLPPTVIDTRDMANIVTTLFLKHVARPAKEFSDVGLVIPFSLHNRKAPGRCLGHIYLRAGDKISCINLRVELLLLFRTSTRGCRLDHIYSKERIKLIL